MPLLLSAMVRLLFFRVRPAAVKVHCALRWFVSGWRLLSDEMTLLSTSDGQIYPVPRPISLKNESIDVIQKLSPAVSFWAGR